MDREDFYSAEVTGDTAVVRGCKPERHFRKVGGVWKFVARSEDIPSADFHHLMTRVYRQLAREVRDGLFLTLSDVIAALEVRKRKQIESLPPPKREMPPTVACYPPGTEPALERRDPTMFEKFTDPARKVMALANQEAHASTTNTLGQSTSSSGSSKKGAARRPRSCVLLKSTCASFGTRWRNS